MTDLAWMKTYIGDEAAVTGHLTAEEFGAYERLRRHFWQHGDLPDDETRLARVTGMEVSRWNEMANAIIPLLAPALAKLMQERSVAEIKRQKKIEAGKIGAAARWDKSGIPGVNSNTNANANSKTIANAMAQPMRNQWPPAPAPDEVRYDERLGTTRVREKELEPSETPYDPPETAELGREFLSRRGVPENQIEEKLTKLMHWRLFPSDISAGGLGR